MRASRPCNGYTPLTITLGPCGRPSAKGLAVKIQHPLVDTIRTPHGLIACAGLVVLGATIAACSSSKPAPPAAQTTAAPPTAVLWGDLKPVVSVKELMKYMIDPVADNIFNAVGSTVTRQGVVDVEPRTEE